MRPPPDPAEVRAVLVRANNWIGDVILASPALHALRRRYSGARITVLAPPAVIPALAGSPDLDEVLPLPESRMARLRLAAGLRGRRFDLAVLFQKAFEAAVLAAAGGARRRYGYATDRRGWLLSDTLDETDAVRTRHHALVFLDLAAAAGAPEAGRTLVFPLAATDRAEAGAILAGAGVGSAEPLVAVHPGASKRPRAWHAERFGRVGARLAARLGGRLVVTGGPGEEDLGARVAAAAGCVAAAPAATVDLTGRTTVKQMGALFERARLFLGSDSGPMHVASAVGTPIVAIFGPGRPEKTAPFVPADRFVALDRRFHCSPCRQRFFRECDPAPSGKPWCLEEIGEEEAFEAAVKLLGA